MKFARCFPRRYTPYTSAHRAPSMQFTEHTEGDKLVTEWADGAVMYTYRSGSKLFANPGNGVWYSAYSVDGMEWSKLSRQPTRDMALQAAKVALVGARLRGVL